MKKYSTEERIKQADEYMKTHSITDRKYKFEVGQIFKNNLCSATIIEKTVFKTNFYEKGYKLKCNNCSNIFIGREYEIEKNHLCPFCSNVEIKIGTNDICTTHPHIIPWLKNINDGYTKNANSHEKIPLVCPNCGYEINTKEIRAACNRGINCPVCGDGISFPNKLIRTILSYFQIEFIAEYKIQGAKFLYDVFMPNNNIIIEMHGKQHYENDTKWKNQKLEEIQMNDKNKLEFALKNGIEHENYIVIDCRTNEFVDIKNNLIISGLFEKIGLKITEKEWKEIFVLSQKSLFLRTIELWNQGVKELSEIEKIVNLKRWCIIQYLKRGASQELCDYSPKKQQQKYGKKVAQQAKETKSIKVRNKTTGICYPSLMEAERSTGVCHCGISKCCKGTYGHAGKTETGELMVWEFVEEEKENKND